MSWLGKMIPYVGFLERQAEELRVVNQRLTDQLLKVTGNEPIFDPAERDQRPFVPLSRDQGGPVKTRQTMEEYLRRLEAEERRLLHDELAALAKENQAST